MECEFNRKVEAMKYLLRYICLGSMLLGSSLSTAQEIRVTEDRALYNPLTQEVTFSLEFDQPPQLFNNDEYNRPEDSFEYVIVYDHRKWDKHFHHNFGEVDATLYSRDVYKDNLLRFDRYTYNPGAPRWEAERHTFPYTLEGNRISFKLPLSVIGDSDGQFIYDININRFGGSTRITRGISLSTSPLMGDLNFDGSVSVEDIRQALPIIVGAKQPLWAQERVGDLDSDELLTIVDAILIMRIVVGLD